MKNLRKKCYLNSLHFFRPKDILSAIINLKPLFLKIDISIFHYIRLQEQCIHLSGEDIKSKSEKYKMTYKQKNYSCINLGRARRFFPS